MKFFTILILLFTNFVFNDNSPLDKEALFIGPFKKLLDFRYVYKEDKQINVTWRDMNDIDVSNINEVKNEDDTQYVTDNSLSNSDCFQSLIDNIKENGTIKYSVIDKKMSKDLLDCIQNKKKNNKQQVIYKDVQLDKELELYPYEKMTLMQNKLRQILKSFDLVSGITIDQNYVQQNDEELQIEGKSDILSQALKIFDENAAGNKFKVVQKMMVSSIILKKVWQLLTTVGGVDLFKCPEYDNKANFHLLKANPLFTQKLVDLDLVQNEIFKNLYEKQQKQKFQKIQQLKEDYNNSYTTEHYQPLNEINIEVENFTNQQTLIKDSYDFPDPLAQLYNVQTKFQNVSRLCDPTMFKQFPVILPKINADMFAFSDEQFSLIYNVDRGHDNGSGQRQFYGQPEAMILDVIQRIQRYVSTKDTDTQENFIKEFDSNIEIIKQNLFLGQDIKSEDEIEQSQIDNIKTYEDVKNLKFKRYDFKYQRWIYFPDNVKSTELIKFLIDPNFLIDRILTLNQKIKHIKMYENTQYKAHILIAKIKALYKLNYSRLLNHIFSYLKFSPLVKPDSYDLYKISPSNQDEYQEIQDKEAKKNYFKRPKGKITDAIRADKPLKKNKEQQESDEDKGSGEQLAEELNFLNASDLTVNLSQNKFNRTASKEHIVYQSFMYFFDDFLKQFVSRDSSLVQCLLPQGQMKRGSQCPVFFKELMNFVSKNPKLQMDFTSVYGLFISLYESDPKDIKYTIQNLLDQMLIFSRFQYNKLLFEKEDVVDELIRKKVFDLYPEAMKIIDDEKREFFEDLYYQVYVFIVGSFIPEFNTYHKNYFFYKYSNKNTVENLLNEINQDFITIPDVNQEQESEQKLDQEDVLLKLI